MVITPPASPNVLVGSTLTLPIAIKDATGQDMALPVAWSSSNATIANVSQSGMVTAVSIGTAIISGSAGGRSASVTLNITPLPPVPTSRVSVSLVAALQIGDSASAAFAAFDAAGNVLTGRSVIWKSRNTSIARISSTGMVSGLSVGSTTIDAEVEGVTGSTTIAVSAIVTPPGTPTVYVVRVTMPDSSATTAGKTVQATATVVDNVGSVMLNQTIVWSSSNPAVATVSPTGVITSVSSGTALALATAGGKTGYTLFTVTITSNSNAPAASVAVTATRTSLFPMLATQATATVRDAANNVLSGKPIVWASPCPSIATVSASGLIAGVSVGTCTITATTGGIVGSIAVQVIATPLAKLTIATTATNIPIGVTTQLNAVLVDSLNAPVALPATWTSATPSVATVSATGLVTGIAAGSSLMTVTSGGLTASVTIAVASPLQPPVATVTVTVPNVVVQPTQGMQATAVTKDANGVVLTGRVINWSSSNNGVASITPNGFINPIGAGTTTITVVSEGKTATVTITVPPVATVTVTSALSTLQPTQTTQAGVTLLDASAAPALNRTVSWSTSDASVVKVSAAGMVTAVAGGTASIIATSEGITGSKTFTVPPVATVSVNAPIVSLIPQQTTTLTATLLDASAAPALNRTTTWTSSSPAVAQVSSTGLVTGLAVGTAVITATSETKTGNVTITIVQPTVASITISNLKPTLLLNQTSQLSTLILDASGRPTNTVTPVWTSSSPTRATVSATGLVTTVGGGTGVVVTFTATVGNVSASTPITVIGHPVEVTAALPTTYLNTAAPAAPASGGVVRSATSSASLAAALIAARPGDVIELANGTTFSGNFILPNKNTTSQLWITIRPANSSGLPAPGSRMTPSMAAAANLPIVLSTSNQGAFATAPGAHHYRLIGLEVSVPASIPNTGLVRLGDDGSNGQTTWATIPHDLVLDRMYVHGTATGTVRRCVSLNSASSAVIDSWISDCHDAGQDSQAIVGWNGPGPFKIVNNYLEAAGENVAFGGTDPAVPNLVPSDVEIRHNHIFKPAAWKGVWLVKNLFELKNAQRVLVEGNVMEGSWLDGQGGSAVVLKSVNQNNTAPWSGTVDVTIRYNTINNVGSGFAISGSPDNPFQDIPLTRVTITDNIVSNIDASAQYNGDGRGVLWNDIPSDVVFAHNTLISPTNTAMAMGPQGTTMNRISIRDNIIGGGAYGIKGGGVAAGTATLNAFIPGGSFLSNAIILPSGAGYPPNNFFPSSTSSVGFASAASLDFRLTGSSTLRSMGTDGSDIGADVTAINTAIAGVVIAP
ncbi:MAG: Ig-like domain-containing protein [bacterium]